MTSELMFSHLQIDLIEHVCNKFHSLKETTKYLLVQTDKCINETDKNLEECNAHEYNKLYSSLPRNINIYLSVTCNRQIYVMYVRWLHGTDEQIGQLALPHATATCPLCSSVKQ
jgi:hypothetical protein